MWLQRNFQCITTQNPPSTYISALPTTKTILHRPKQQHLLPTVQIHRPIPIHAHPLRHAPVHPFIIILILTLITTLLAPTLILLQPADPNPPPHPPHPPTPTLDPAQLPHHRQHLALHRQLNLIHHGAAEGESEDSV
jgi:hypothetical protein